MTQGSDTPQAVWIIYNAPNGEEQVEFIVDLVEPGSEERRRREHSTIDDLVEVVPDILWVEDPRTYGATTRYEFHGLYEKLSDELKAQVDTVLGWELINWLTVTEAFGEDMEDCVARLTEPLPELNLSRS